MNGTVIIKLLTIILIIPDSNRKNSETYQYSSRRILLFIFRVFRKIKPIPSLLCVCVPVRQYNLHRMVSLDANESLLLLLRLLFLYFLLVLLPYIYIDISSGFRELVGNICWALPLPQNFPSACFPIILLCVWVHAAVVVVGNACSCLRPCIYTECGVSFADVNI